jgi:putative oxidoreductase
LVCSSSVWALACRFFWYHGYPKLAGGPETWERIGDAVANVGITFAHPAWGLAAALSEGAGGLLFAAGLFFGPCPWRCWV